MNISELAKKLRTIANDLSIGHNMPISLAIERFREASDTIEALYAKLQAENAERSDMISRNKLIEEIDKEIDGVIVKDTYSKGKNAGLRKAKILAEEQIVTHYIGGWIACEDRLPGKYCHCLVTRRNDYEDGFDTDVKEDVWIELEGVWDWQSKHEGLIDNIIAWQPLPEPYRP